MLIRNKKTGKEENVTPDQWTEMESKGLANLFKVISRKDVPVEKKEIVIPEEVKQLRSKKDSKNKKTVE